MSLCEGGQRIIWRHRLYLCGPALQMLTAAADFGKDPYHCGLLADVTPRGISFIQGEL